MNAFNLFGGRCTRFASSRGLLCALTAAALLAIAVRASAFAPDRWAIVLGSRDAGVIGSEIGCDPRAVYPPSVDHGWLDAGPDDRGVFTLMYRDWSGSPHWYGADLRPAIPSGTNETWSDIYLWVQNYALNPPNTVRFLAMPESGLAPTGYWGHLVLDHVPASANWTGPMDFWLNLGQYNQITMPITQVTDPLQGTRMHLTIYAPEPSSLLALLAGLAGFGTVLRRRR